MWRSLSARFHALGLRKCLQVLVPLLALGGLVACGGSGSVHEEQGYSGNPITNVCTSGTFASSSTSGVQPNTFFDMHINATEPTTPWPGVQFGGIRLWDSGTGWAEINFAAGACDFSHMDAWLTEAQANNTDVLYNLARTPTWASSGPTDTTCSYAAISGGPGQCHPPIDLNSDGSGPDSIWIGWVTSVVSRYAGQIKFYEIWNEWNVSSFWVGTPQQLVRMTQDARCVIEGAPKAAACNSESVFPSGTGLDPNARVVTPSPVGAQTELNAVQTNMNTFLSSQVNGVGPGNFVDIIGFHCYVSTLVAGDYPVPEDVLTVISDLNGILPGFTAVQGDALFCTEGGWGRADIEDFNDPVLQAGFLARYYLLQNSTNVARVYWYVWDSSSDNGSLWSSIGGPTPAAIAYGEIYKWINGAALSNRCSVNGTVWTCTYTRPNGYQALAVWDGNTASTCYTAGAPACSTFTIPTDVSYTLYRDLSGNETAVAGPTISLSAQPILLETSTLP